MGVNKSDFEYLKGEDLVKTYVSSDWAQRTFCSKCGSSLMYLLSEMPDKVFVASGLMEKDFKLKPKRHIFVKDKCEWYDINDNIPQIERY